MDQTKKVAAMSTPNTHASKTQRPAVMLLDLGKQIEIVCRE
jgi:hypothetical protein